MKKYFSHIAIILVFVFVAGINIYLYRPKFSKAECKDIEEEMTKITLQHTVGDMSAKDFHMHTVIRALILKEDCPKHKYPWGFFYK